VISRICEEFDCLPSQAIHEPLQLALDVMDLRAYAKAKHLYEHTKDAKDIPDAPIMDWVYRISYERKQAKNRQREARQVASEGGTPDGESELSAEGRLPGGGAARAKAQAG
jgi:hypothetical protein